MRPEDPGYPRPTSEAVSAVMRGNRKLDSRPEVQLRSRLHRIGYRFRKNPLLRVQGLAVRPDLVFPRYRLVVFVDGCFWHGCPDHGNLPKVNTAYWASKLQGNRARDRRVTERLKAAGWRVVRLWEHLTAHDMVQTVTLAIESPTPL